jgi:hypothetical protein
MDLKFDTNSFTELYDDLLKLILGKGYSGHDDLITEQLLFKVRELEPHTYQLLLQIRNQWMAYSFVKKDKELKIKMPDIWTEQSEQLKEEYLDSLIVFHDYALDKDRGIDMILEKLRGMVN